MGLEPTNAGCAAISLSKFLARAEEAVWRAVYRHSVEQAAYEEGVIT